MMKDIPAIVSETYRKTLPCSNNNVVIRPARVKEERLWLVGKDSGQPKDLIDALINVTQNCIADPHDFKVMDMSYNDFVWLFLEIMKISKGDTIHLDLQCQNEECMEIEKRLPFNISEITVIKNLGVNKSHIVKLTENSGVELKYPTVAYMLSLDNEKKDILKNRRLAELDLIQHHIVAYLKEESRYSFDDTQTSIDWTNDNLSNKDIEKIKEWFINEPAPSFNIKWTCPKCKLENTLEDIQLLRFLEL